MQGLAAPRSGQRRGAGKKGYPVSRQVYGGESPCQFEARKGHQFGATCETGNQTRCSGSISGISALAAVGFCSQELPSVKSEQTEKGSPPNPRFCGLF